MLYKHLKQMKKRPALFPCDSVKDIYTFIDGYTLTLDSNNFEENDVKDFGSFTDFVKEYYGQLLHHLRKVP